MATPNRTKELARIKKEALAIQGTLNKRKEAEKEPVDLSSIREGVEPYEEPNLDLRDLSVAFSGKASEQQMQDLANRNPALASKAMDSQGYGYVDPKTGQTVDTFQEMNFDQLEPEEQIRRTADSVAAEIAAIEERMANTETLRTNAYEDSGVFDDMQTLNALKAEKMRLEDRSIEIPIEGRKMLRGRMATKTDFNQLTQPAVDKNVLETLAASRNVSRMTDVVNTNIAIIDQKIKAQTDKDEFLYTQKKDRLIKLESVFGNIITEKQKIAAEEKKFQYDLALEAVKTDNSLRSDLIKEIAKKGVGGVQLQGLMDASIDELVSFQADLGSPRNWSEMSYEEAAMVLDKESFDKYKVYKEFEKTATEEEKAAVNQGLAVEQTAQSTIKLLEDMLGDEKGLKTSVGVGLGNRDFNIFGLGDESTKFRAKAKQLLSQATLDKLLELKAAGGTLGAISEKELEILSNAATALGSVVDDNGNATGRFKFKEEDFKEALETMRLASMKTYIASRIGKDKYANADYMNADFDTIQKRYTDLIESGPSDSSYADDELQQPGTYNFGTSKVYMTPTLDLLRQEEGLRTDAYQDITGTWTIGYGNTQINGRPVRPGDRLSEDQAETLLRTSVVNNYTNFVDNIDKEISPNQFAALTSFEYNLGPGVWNTPTGNRILALVNSGQPAEAGRLMLQYNKARNPSTGQLETNRVLAARRAREADLLLT